MMHNSLSMGLGCLNLNSDNHAIIDYAIEKGVTVFDTADCYGAGESEKALGAKIKNYPRENFYISTKCGISFQQDGIHISGTSEYINQACDASLKRLQTEYIDLYYLHRVDPETPIETSVSALANLVKAGKIKYIGLSEVTEDQLRRASRIHPVTAVQIEFSPWARQDESNGVIAACKELGITVVAYSPLGRALFTTCKAEYFNQLSSQDFRKLLPRYEGDKLELNIKARDELQKFASEKGCTLAQLVLAWEMSFGFTVIPATTNQEHLNENLSALLVNIAESDKQEMDDILNQIKFHGPRYPSNDVSGIFPEKSGDSLLTKRNILLGLGFVTAVGGLFAYSRCRASVNVSDVENVLSVSRFNS